MVQQIVAAAVVVVAFCATCVAYPYTPHLIDRIPNKRIEDIPGSGKPMAIISALYQVDTEDFDTLKNRISDQMAFAINNLPYPYFKVTGTQNLLVGRRCELNSLRCTEAGGVGFPSLAPGLGGAGADGSLLRADPRECAPVDAANGAITLPVDPLLPTDFEPTWQTPEELEWRTYRTNLCVSPKNTSLMYGFLLEIKDVYITGWRDDENSYITKDESLGIKFEMHVLGSIRTDYARFLNAKFVLNGSIPLPLYQPEVEDLDATHTDPLNISVQILGIRQGTYPSKEGKIITYFPTCTEPKIAVKGCFRMDIMMYEHPLMTEYKLKYIILWRRNTFTKLASEQPYPDGDFNVSEGPWTQMKWLMPPKVEIDGPWTRHDFPQKEYKYQYDCQYGNGCEVPSTAPSARHLHTAVMYETWKFENHARKYLCNELPGCGEDCLTNLTCLGGKDYYQQNFYFRSSAFRYDDDGIVPFSGLDDPDCPRSCCKDRRLCLRVFDVLGYEVPYQSQMMLVFGGKTYVHEKDPNDGKLIYHNCERIPGVDMEPDWRGCKELIVNDLWRYDIVRGKWEFIKPDSANSPTDNQPVGYPIARFGHSAAIIQEVDSRDPDSKRIFMYIYGGMGPECPGGVCNDVWKYEIPFAAQAYYPKFPDGEWDRGNKWDKLKDCPYGGRYRHSMVATTGQEYIYVYGGQGLGGFFNTLLRYRVSTDMWEDLLPFGRVSLTRLMYDHRGDMKQQEVPIDEYNPDIDVDCPLAWRFDGKWAHCQKCPTCRLTTGRRDKGADMPASRGDYALATFVDHTPGAIDDALVMFGGFRTLWGQLTDPAEECPTTTSTTTAPSTTAADVELISLTEAPPRTTTVITTTLYEESGGMNVIGTFPNNPTTTTTITTLMTTTTLYRRLQQDTTTIDPSGSTQGREEVIRVGPGACDPNAPPPTYYFDDLWMFDAGTNQWVRRLTKGEVPMARKGHTMVARRASTNDTQLVMFGGHNQDLSLGDMWILDLMRETGERIWTRIDPYIAGIRPPSMSYQTMLWSPELNFIVMFGGLHWDTTNTTESDGMRNVDRRCYKEAQGLPVTYADTEELLFFIKMTQLCSKSDFCCVLTQQRPVPLTINGIDIRNATGHLNLTSVSQVCRNDCKYKSFYPQFYPIMEEGVWTFNTEVCAGNCSGNGYCEMSQCVCQPDWYGLDCSQRRCPGSMCYTQPQTKEQFCVDCSQHGRCVDGECMCFPGWAYEDCSVPECEANCSSTAIEAHGICVPDFPVHQCACLGRYSGSNCSELLCLNDCSNRGDCVDGSCKCQKGFYGDDCSIFTWGLVDG